jgi:hypothetical protein
LFQGDAMFRLLGAGALLALCACETTSPTYSAANAPVYQPVPVYRPTYYPPTTGLDPGYFSRIMPRVAPQRVVVQQDWMQYRPIFR